MNFLGLNEYKGIGIPLAHALLWVAGLMFTLWGTSFFEVDDLPMEMKEVYAISLVYVLFLVEVALSYLDIGYNYIEQNFSSHVFKTTGKVFLNLVATVFCGALYIKTKSDMWLIAIIALSALMKYASVRMSRSVEVYYATEGGHDVFVSNI